MDIEEVIAAILAIMKAAHLMEMEVDSVGEDVAVVNGKVKDEVAVDVVRLVMNTPFTTVC